MVPISAYIDTRITWTMQCHFLLKAAKESEENLVVMLSNVYRFISMVLASFRNKTIAYVSISLVCISAPILAQVNTDIISIRENAIKSVFIHNIIRYYVNWPELDTSDVFVIGSIGESDLIEPLKEITKNLAAHNKKIKIIHYQELADINTCDVLFISEMKKKRLENILQRLQNKNILTISDTKGFANRGVAINFVNIEGKIKLEINTNAIDRAGLQVSSQLLKLALLVKEEKKDVYD